MDASKMLQAILSGDAKARPQAEAALAGLSNSNLPAYIELLGKLFANKQEHDAVRALAGVMLKNVLHHPNAQTRGNLHKRWVALPDALRNGIKELVIATMSDKSKDVSKAASQVFANIAAAEFPARKWDNVIEFLHNGITKAATDEVKQAFVTSLGYICEEIPDALAAKSNIVLSAIHSGLTSQNVNIKLAAITALQHSLGFVKANMAAEGDRAKIMKMVMDAAKPPSEDKVRETAFMCLVEMATRYYDQIAGFMPDIFVLTGKAIQKEDTGVQLQAIEFWSSICTEERKRREEMLEYQERGQKPKLQNMQFALKALEKLVPVLLVALTTQAEELDDNVWDVATAAGCCLDLLAQTTGNEIIPRVLPFVYQHIRSENWRFRDAATLAFGCILNGPTKEDLKQLVEKAFPTILDYMKDKHPIVKDSAAWAVGRICELLPRSISTTMLPRLMSALVEGLSQPAKIAQNVCWAIHNLTEVNITKGNTSVLSPYFNMLMTALFATTAREDFAEEYNLQVGTYEAINGLVQSAAPDCYATVEKLIPALLEKLKQTLTSISNNANQTALERMFQTQSLLCGALQAVVLKLDAKVVLPKVRELMDIFLKILEINTQAQGSSKQPVVQEEVLMAVGAVANRTEKNFATFWPTFKPLLFKGFANPQASAVVQVTCGTLGHVVTALGDLLRAPTSQRDTDEIVQHLLSALQTAPQYDRTLVPHIIATLGDVAMALSGSFERYLDATMKWVVPLSGTSFKNPDLDALDYLRELREAVLAAYSAIVQGLYPDNKVQLFKKHLQSAFALLHLIANDPNTEDTTVAAACSLIGDIASTMEGDCAEYVSAQSVKQLIERARSSPDPNTAQAGDWAKEFLN